MKTTNSKFLNITLLLAAVGLSLAVSPALADHGGDDNLRGSEHFRFDVMMVPTAAAAAGSSARVKLEAEDEHGVATAELELKARHFIPGVYFIRTTQKSDGSSVALGSFTTQGEGEAEIKFGEDGRPFPPNFSPFDIATISVLNSSNVVLFTLDLRQLALTPGMTRTATVDAVPGPMFPNAAGTVILNAFVSGGKARGSLQLIGHGLPPKLRMAVTVNGVIANVKKAKSDNSGNVTVRLTPNGRNSTIATGINLFQASSLRLTDNFGNTVLRADF